MNNNNENIIFGNGNIITLGAENRQISGGAIFCKDGIIEKIGETDELRREFPRAEFVDLQGRLTLPGNVICHTHLYSSFARGMSLKDEVPSNFTEILQRLWWRLDKALSPLEIYYSAMPYLIQCIRCGTTTIIDHHASPSSIEGSLDILQDACFDAGIRASLCYEVTDRNGETDALEGIRENERFLEKIKSEPEGLVTGALGIHASFTVSEETLGKCVETAKKFDAPIHLHVEEDLADRKDSIEKYGMPVLARLKKSGAADLPLLAAHCVHVSAEEFDILKEKNISVVHNPSSNMNNAVGVAPVIDMLKKNITVGLGTDGMTADLFQEMKILPLLHKINTRDPRTYSFPRVYDTIFANSGKIGGIFWKKAGIGGIKEGNYCDFITMDYDPPTPMTKENILGHILFGMNCAMVNTTVVSGKILMKDRKIDHLDEEKIMANCRKLAVKTWEKF